MVVIVGGVRELGAKQNLARSKLESTKHVKKGYGRGEPAI